MMVMMMLMMMMVLKMTWGVEGDEGRHSSGGSVAASPSLKIWSTYLSLSPSCWSCLWAGICTISYSRGVVIFVMLIVLSISLNVWITNDDKNLAKQGKNFQRRSLMHPFFILTVYEGVKDYEMCVSEWGLWILSVKSPAKPEQSYLLGIQFCPWWSLGGNSTCLE